MFNDDSLAAGSGINNSMVDYVLVQYPIINLAYYLMLLITHLVELSITACRDEEAIVTANTALTVTATCIGGFLLWHHSHKYHHVAGRTESADFNQETTHIMGT